MWWSKRKQRQALILSVALTWYRVTRRLEHTPGFIEEEVFITNLTREVKDARHILNQFFDVKRIGFRFNESDRSPTIVSPKKLDAAFVAEIESILNEVKFNPGLPPLSNSLTKSLVKVRQHQRAFIIQQLKTQQREDLLPAVSWLLKQKEITFYYKPSGKLQARDTSVWPIKAIELWPGWLRAELFGTVVDIENAYVQFLVQQLSKKYANDAAQLALKYPDILRANGDKKRFREELCRDVLQREPTAQNIKIIKSVIMALANGSTASAALMTNGSCKSEVVRIVREANPDATPTDLLKAGERLRSIARQFSAAKRDLCIYFFKAAPTRINQKRIFKMYFDWEKEARYKIWNATGRTGLHLHDGLDGVITDLSEEELIAHVEKETSIRVSVDKFCEDFAV